MNALQTTKQIRKCIWINLDDQLKKINTKLNNVLTKDDTSFITQIIKETVNELKETLLASLLHEIETVESDLHNVAKENESLKQEVTKLKKTIDANEEIHIKNSQNKTILKVDEKLNEQEQYSRKKQCKDHYGTRG